MMLKAHFEVEAANLTINEGAAGAIFDKIFAICPPEAAYFVSDQGKRSLYAFLDVQSAHQIPLITEPLFHGFAATVEVLPVLTPDDLAKGLQGFAASR
jgi:hypothetical protein